MPRIAVIAAHPWQFRIGWLPWQMCAVADLLLAVAIMRVAWLLVYIGIAEPHAELAHAAVVLRRTAERIDDWFPVPRRRPELAVVALRPFPTVGRSI